MSTGELVVLNKTGRLDLNRLALKEIQAAGQSHSAYLWDLLKEFGDRFLNWIKDQVENQQS